MTSKSFSFSLLVLVAATALLGASLAGQSLPKLPNEILIQRSADSPGPVAFNHDSHVDTTAPDCTVCHPKPFSILKQRSTPPVAILHARMEKGDQCGKCHDGKKAFALDDCAACHR